MKYQIYSFSSCTSRKDDPGWVWDHFETTPPMSTMSLAFTVSDFVPLKCNSTCPTSIVKIWGPTSDLSKGDFALKSAAAIIDYLEKYFGIRYPMPKLDLLAVPNLGQAATENWGLISFRYVYSINFEVWFDYFNFINFHKFLWSS